METQSVQGVPGSPCLPPRDNGEMHLAALDGIRGVAILGVLCCHISEFFWFLDKKWRTVPAIFHCGWAGVDLFFVLSGFLITGILWDNRGSPHYFRNFYGRRVLRLMPLYYGILIVIFVLLPMTLPWIAGQSPLISPARAEIMALKHASSQWPWYFSYMLNFWIASRPDPTFPGHLWSLSVEEHFYLIWPVLMNRLKHTTMMITSGAIIIGALLVRWCLINRIDFQAIYVLTPCRIDSIAFGALVALLFRRSGGPAFLTAAAKYCLPISCVVCCIIAALSKGWGADTPLSATLGYTFQSIFFASILVFAITQKFWAAIFSNSVLRFFGKYSYGIYVLHVLIFRYTSGIFRLGRAGHFSLLSLGWASPFRSAASISTLASFLDGVVFIIVSVCLTVGAALLSWRILELPSLRLKRFFPNEPRHSRELALELNAAS